MYENCYHLIYKITSGAQIMKTARSRIFLICFLAVGLLLHLPPAYGQYDNMDFPSYDGESFPSYYDDDDDSSYSSYFDDDSGSPGQYDGYYDQNFGTEPAPVAPARTILPPGDPIKIEEKSIRVGRIPYRSMREMMTQAVPLLRSLQKKTGAKEVRLVSSSTDYKSVLDSLARGSVDFAWVGPTAYINRRDSDHLMPVAKARFGDETAYRGVFIALDKGKVQGLEDLKRNCRIGFVDPESASGYIYPIYLLMQLKINPYKNSKVFFLKNHDNVLRAVLAGKIDAGVCLEDSLNSIKDPEIRKRIIVLAKTSEIPSDVIVCRQDAPLNLREKFLAALLEVKAEDNGKPLTFLKADDEDFASVEAVINYVDSIKGKSKK